MWILEKDKKLFVNSLLLTSSVKEIEINVENSPFGFLTPTLIMF